MALEFVSDCGDGLIEVTSNPTWCGLAQQDFEIIFLSWHIAKSVKLSAVGLVFDLAV
jgi:hypothetical protein